MRRIRGGGAALGFGLALAIVFVYYVILTIALSIGSLALAARRDCGLDAERALQLDRTVAFATGIGGLMAGSSSSSSSS